MTRPKPITMWALAYVDDAGVIHLETDDPIIGRTRAQVIVNTSHRFFDEEWEYLFRAHGSRVIKVRVEAV